MRGSNYITHKHYSYVENMTKQILVLIASEKYPLTNEHND